MIDINDKCFEMFPFKECDFFALLLIKAIISLLILSLISCFDLLYKIKRRISTESQY